MEAIDFKDFSSKFKAVEEEIRKSIIGQDKVITQVLIGIIAGGNVLVEGTPGLGKTQLVKKLSEVLDLPFSRIQFTPDLMPSDILGTTIINQLDEKLSFKFEKGPIFSSLLLADEINRATPKTQSALLEAMEEKNVTINNMTYKLPEPFFVFATKNPIEMEGTYPLPEAQLDRFMFKLNIDLPDRDSLMKIVEKTTSGPREFSKFIISSEDIMKMKEVSEKILVSKDVMEYAVDLMMATHPQTTNLEIVRENVESGVSPRGIQAIVRSSKVKALRDGRYHVTKEDIKDLAIPCFRHRIFMNFKSSYNNVDSDRIINEVIEGMR